MNDEMLAQIVSTIVRVASPEQVILFGSHARGDAGPESDLDLLVIESGTFDQAFDSSEMEIECWFYLMGGNYL